MADEPEVILQQMEATRSNLTEKLAALEQQVVGTVQTTTDAVTETVASVKDAVQETVASVQETVTDTVGAVKEAFDIRRYVDEYPWASFGAAVAVGFVGGRMLNFGGPSSPKRNDPGHYPAGAVGTRPPLYTPPAEPGFAERFTPEISKVKGMAIGFFGSLVRDLVSHSVAGQFRGQLTNLIDDVTRKFGGQPVAGPVLPDVATRTPQHERERANGLASAV